MKLAQNSQKTAKKKTRGRPFPKGVSGNPGGRPKIPPEITAAFKEYTFEALEVILKNMRLKGTSYAHIRQRAAVEILNRGWGTPPQTIKAEDDRPIPTVRLNWEYENPPYEKEGEA